MAKKRSEEAEETAEVPKPAEEAKSENPSKRERYLLATYGKTRGERMFAEEQAKGKELYP